MLSVAEVKIGIKPENILVGGPPAEPAQAAASAPARAAGKA